MSEQPITVAAVPNDPTVTFPSDGTPYAAPAPADAQAALPEPAPAAPVDPAVDGVPTAPSVEAPAGGQLLTLPSGHKVALRGTRSIRNRDRKRLFDGVDPNGEDKLSAGFTILANIEKLLITAWDVRDFDDATGEPIGDILPIPSATTDDVLGGLSVEDAAALDKPAEEAQKVLLPNFEPSPDDASPTQPSAG